MMTVVFSDDNDNPIHAPTRELAQKSALKRFPHGKFWMAGVNDGQFRLVFYANRAAYMNGQEPLAVIYNEEGVSIN